LEESLVGSKTYYMWLATPVSLNFARTQEKKGDLLKGALNPNFLNLIINREKL